MKQPKRPGFVGEVGEELEKTVEVGKKEAAHSLGEAFEELLRSLFGTTKPLSPEEKKRLEEEEKKEKRLTRAQVLEEFMPTPEEERVYHRKQKEEAIKKAKKAKEAKEKAWVATARPQKGRSKVGALFESLRRKVTQTERKIGGKF